MTVARLTLVVVVAFAVGQLAGVAFTRVGGSASAAWWVVTGAIGVTVTIVMGLTSTPRTPRQPGGGAQAD